MPARIGSGRSGQAAITASSAGSSGGSGADLVLYLVLRGGGGFVTCCRVVTNESRSLGCGPRGRGFKSRRSPFGRSSETAPERTLGPVSCKSACHTVLSPRSAPLHEWAGVVGPLGGLPALCQRRRRAACQGSAGTNANARPATSCQPSARLRRISASLRLSAVGVASGRRSPPFLIPTRLQAA